MPAPALDRLVERLAAHVGATRTTSHLPECLTEADAMVSHHIGKNKVPEVIRDRALLETAADLFWRRHARNGIATFDGGDGLEVLRIGLDPMASARTILAPYLGVGIA